MSKTIFPHYKLYYYEGGTLKKPQKYFFEAVIDANERVEYIRSKTGMRIHKYQFVLSKFESPYQAEIVKIYNPY